MKGFRKVRSAVVVAVEQQQQQLYYIYPTRDPCGLSIYIYLFLLFVSEPLLLLDKKKIHIELVTPIREDSDLTILFLTPELDGGGGDVQVATQGVEILFQTLHCSWQCYPMPIFYLPDSQRVIIIEMHQISCCNPFLLLAMKEKETQPSTRLISKMCPHDTLLLLLFSNAWSYTWGDQFVVVLWAWNLIQLRSIDKQFVLVFLFVSLPRRNHQFNFIDTQ